MSVVATPEAATVTVVPQAPAAIAAVVIAAVPEAKVIVTVPEEGNVAVELMPVPPLVFANKPVTCVARFTTVTAPMEARAASTSRMIHSRFMPQNR